MGRKYFGTDGIRGKANAFPMTADMALKVAMATATILKKSSCEPGHQSRAIIGKDTRLSGYMLEQAMASGFVAMGMDVLLVGPIPTPGIAMLTRSLRADVGVMISASHNPFEDNGIKLFGADGFKLDDNVEEQIEAAMGTDLNSQNADPQSLGKASRLDDALGRYIEFVKSSLPRGQTLDGLKVVVDCANGAAYKVAPQVLWELEAEVITIGNNPNGRNINLDYGATKPQNLQKAVLEHSAHIGLALDGDADRLIVVDEKGKVVDGDQILALIATTWKECGQLTNDTVVATVMSNLGLERYLTNNGMTLARTPVGDRYVVEHMREGGFNLGGEQSGHIVMTDYGTTGDGVMAALHVLSALKTSGKTASEYLRRFEPFPQILKNVRFEKGDDPLGNGDVKAAIAASEAKLGSNGRIFVRMSGTEPVIRVMGEGEDVSILENEIDGLCDLIANTARMKKVS